MKTTSKLVTTILASGLVVFAGCASPRHASTTWEYRVVRCAADSSNIQDQLNRAAADGFTLVSTMPSQTLPGEPNTPPFTILILKRAEK
jgi:hypothetical protein